MRRLPALLLPLVLVASCQRTPPAVVHYELGPAYRSAGRWHYPREEFARTETGLAEAVTAGPTLTADGERFDAGALTGSHPTLQLPALARITDLDTGRSLVVRLNDRGPASATRTLGLSRRAVELLGSADPSAIPYRLELLGDDSRRMAAALHTDAQLPIQAAPTGAVQAESLAAPTGAARAATEVGARRAAAADVAAPPADAAASVTRLPETVTQAPPRAHRLAIECASFSRSDYADLLRARLQALGAVTVTDYSAPRDRAYIVRIPGIAAAAAADRLLQQAIAAGATDARIVVD